MEEKKKEIVKAALDVYMKFGIKSVTMDEMARQLGVSKKTLYLHFKDKNDLVESCLAYGHDCDMEGVQCITDRNLNAIEEMLEVGRYIIKTLSSIHPSIFFDLNKYHPKAWKQANEQKYESMKASIITNLKKGMEEGLYRDNLTPDILARVHMATMDAIISTDIISVSEFKVNEVYSEYFRYHIRGLASEKGLECLKELIRKDENL